MRFSQDAPARIQRWTIGIGATAFVLFTGLFVWANWSPNPLYNMANMAGGSMGGAICMGLAGAATKVWMRFRLGVA